jgi:hypothetical protein
MIDAQGSFSGIEGLPARLQQAVKSALTTGELARPPVLAELREQPAKLSGPSDGIPFELLSPLGKVIETDRPTFRWRRLPGATSYTVTVTDAKLDEVATSPALTSPEWNTTRPLEYGTMYTWQVTALKDGKPVRSPVLPAPQAKFRVIDRTTLEELNALRRTQPASHLSLGILYAQAGLVDEAEKELNALAKSNPKVEVVVRLLRSVRSFKRL